MAGDKLYVAGNLANFYGATLNNKTTNFSN